LDIGCISQKYGIKLLAVLQNAFVAVWVRNQILFCHSRKCANSANQSLRASPTWWGSESIIHCL